MEASAALPRERTFAYHQLEAVAALISSGEAHFQHSPSRGGKRELGAEGAASLSISSHGACKPAPRARGVCSRRAASAARASGTAQLTRGHVPPARPIQDADAIQSRVRPGESTLEFWSATLRTPWVH